jgi:nucleotide-binding universal stress UspA family protein
MPKTIIVPVDGSDASERAVHVAQRLATQLDRCELVVMTASGPDDEDRRDYLDSLVGQATVAGVRAEFIEDPVPAVAIVRLAERLSDATVCMAAHGRGRIAAPFLGSVATSVVRQSTTPVLLVGPHCETEWWHSPPKLVACWAGTGSNAVLAWSRQWVDDLGAEFWLESVFHSLDTRMAENPRAEFEPALASLGSDIEVHLLPIRADYPPGAIVQSARDLPATLLAMTTHARTGIAHTALGSVAMDVVHRSPCPVLVAHS